MSATLVKRLRLRLVSQLLVSHVTENEVSWYEVSIANTYSGTKINLARNT